MVEIFKALSEESRLHILAILIQGEMCVCEIEDCLQMTQSNASRRLTALKNCGILESNKKAQWAYYKISDSFKEEHQALWLYLVGQLEKSPVFQAEVEECQKFKRQDLCKCKT